MSDQKRNTDFTLDGRAVPLAKVAAGIEESQPWRAPDREKALSMWKDGQNAGCDPYNSVGTRAYKISAA